MVRRLGRFLGSLRRGSSWVGTIGCGCLGGRGVGVLVGPLGVGTMYSTPDLCRLCGGIIVRPSVGEVVPLLGL